MTEKIKVVIDRSKWRTGRDGPYATGSTDETSLRDSVGCQCCLGFVAKACGYSDESIQGAYGPNDIEFDRVGTEIVLKPGIVGLVRLVGNSLWQDAFLTDLTNHAMSINDDESSPPAQKEQKLIELFKDSPYELEFTGEYVYPLDKTERLETASQLVAALENTLLHLGHLMTDADRQSREALVQRGKQIFGLP